MTGLLIYRVAKTQPQAKGVGRKFSRGRRGQRKKWPKSSKKWPKNCTIKPLSNTLFFIRTIL